MSNLILNIETTTKNCSVSLAENAKTLSMREINEGGYSHAENLHPYIDQVLQDAHKSYKDLSAIAVSKGPGSYTGLRIGVSAAKGLSFALDIPLISVDTLKALSQKVIKDEGVIIPILDARRMEVYQAVYSVDYELIEATKAAIVESNSYENYLENGKVYFLGDAVEKVQAIISHPNAIFLQSEFPSAKEMGPLSFEKFQQQDFEDVAYFEPYYLKDFIAIKSTKKPF